MKSDSLFGDADNLSYGARLKLSRKRRSKDTTECKVAAHLKNKAIIGSIWSEENIA